jgi:protein-S-isoprenylcysteine O-methyltransferase Ste14
MGRNWLVARTRSDHELVTSGPFAHVRHPIYSAMALLLLVLAVGLSNAWRPIVTLQLYAHGAWLHIAEEEKLLHATLGPRFRGYAAGVKRFVRAPF